MRVRRRLVGTGSIASTNLSENGERLYVSWLDYHAMEDVVSTNHRIIDSPLGELTLVAHNGVLAGLYFSDHVRGPDQKTFGSRAANGFEAAVQQLAEYFRGHRVEFDIPIAPRGTTFQQRVWTLLRAIPYGETRTYGQLARDMGNPALAREVGGANARNPISIIVPCHRVIGADGRLTGYAGGLERKRFLLDLEGAPSAAQIMMSGLS